MSGRVLWFGVTQTSNSTIELRNSSFYEPERELTFVDPVKLEPELHLEIPVPFIRTELWDLNSGIKRNLNQNSNIFVHFIFYQFSSGNPAYLTTNSSY